MSDSRNRASIEANGLDLLHSQDGKHVWLYGDLQAARAHRDMFSGKTRTMDGALVTMDVYKVDTTGMRIAKDPHAIMTDVGNVTVRKGIPPSRVQRIE